MIQEVMGSTPNIGRPQPKIAQQAREAALLVLKQQCGDARLPPSIRHRAAALILGYSTRRRERRRAAKQAKPVTKPAPKTDAPVTEAATEGAGKSVVFRPPWLDPEPAATPVEQPLTG